MTPTKRPLSPKTSLLLRVYGAAWTVSLPFLGLSSRLRQGWPDRVGGLDRDSPVDVWVQAASAGEAYLALEVARRFLAAGSGSIHITSWTAQGMGVLEEERARLDGDPSSRAFSCAYFPFDRPGLMKRALRRLQPKVMVLLETEIWPGLLWACRRQGVPVLIVNGRLSARSLRAYLVTKRLWEDLGPREVLAVSPDDAGRYERLFGGGRVRLMNNIKFDRIRLHPPDAATPSPVARILPPSAPFVVLGSIREEEEEDILRTARTVLDTAPHAVVGLFPRHLHRLKAWERRLRDTATGWTFRSRLSGASRPGTLILWDRFGELDQAYGSAQAVFVGGSLRACGGQNFLEPLAWGVVPCVGPHRENFSWVGQEIFAQGLAREVADWKGLARLLCQDLTHPPQRSATLARAEAYLRERRGGTEAACKAVLRHLRSGGVPRHDRD